MTTSWSETLRSASARYLCHRAHLSTHLQQILRQWRNVQISAISERCSNVSCIIGTSRFQPSIAYRVVVCRLVEVPVVVVALLVLHKSQPVVCFLSHALIKILVVIYSSVILALTFDRIDVLKRSILTNRARFGLRLILLS